MRIFQVYNVVAAAIYNVVLAAVDNVSVVEVNSITVAKIDYVVAVVIAEYNFDNVLISEVDNVIIT